VNLAANPRAKQSLASNWRVSWGSRFPRPCAVNSLSPGPPAFLLKSPESGTDYWIYADAPEDDAGPYPCVMFLDGDDQFRYAVTACRRARESGNLQPLLLLGVGYGASYTKPGNRRIRDYTPTAMETEPQGGGGARFLAFLIESLWPEVRTRYPVSDEARGIAGHSLGALLVLQALFQPQPFFDRALASAPSLWWDNRRALCDARTLQESGASIAARLFLGVGERDSPSTLGDLEQLEDQLSARPFPGLQVTSRRFPDRDHYNVLVDSFAAGLAVLYGGT